MPEGFLNLGYVLPFERLHPVRSVERILRFMIAVYHLDLRRDDLVLDLGAGFAWTTEWLQRLGYRPIAVDINRDYLEISLKRLGEDAPPLLVADVENLPFRPEKFNAALFFDSFHHIAERKKTLEEVAALLKPGGRLILAEPGIGHELHPHSQEVTRTYGLLEKGTSAEEIAELIKKTDFLEKNSFGKKLNLALNYFFYPLAWLAEKLLQFGLRFLLEQERERRGISSLGTLDLLLYLSRGDIDFLVRETNFLSSKKTQIGYYSLKDYFGWKRTVFLLMRKFLLFWRENFLKKTRLIRKFPYSYGEVEMILLKKKGERHYDSRSPDFLNANLSSELKVLKLKPGEPGKLCLSIRNTGNTKWLSATRDGVGEVKIGGRLLSKEGKTIKESFFIKPLPQDIYPGQELKIEIDLPAVQQSGEYILECDLLAWGIMWFKDCYPDAYFLPIEVSQ